MPCHRAPTGGGPTPIRRDYTSFWRTAQKASAAERGQPRSGRLQPGRRVGRDALYGRWPRQPTPTSSQRNTSGRAGWKRLARLLRCGRDRPGGGFPNAGYEPHPSCGDCPLTRSEPAKKSGRNIPKNRCRTTVAERMLETLAELPFIGDQVVCLSHDQAGGQRRQVRED